MLTIHSMQLVPVVRRLLASRLASAVGLLAFLLPAAALAQPSWTGDFAIPAFDGQVTACALLDGHPVVAGDFRWSGEVPVRNIAIWTGSEWMQPGEGLPSRVNCLAVRDGHLIAGIGFTPSRFSPVMEFDGIGWRPLGPELYGSVDALFLHGADLYAAGWLSLTGLGNGYRVVRWNGSSWQPVGSFDNIIHSLAWFGGELYAGGEFLRADDAFASRIARWDGSRWSDVGVGSNAGVAALEIFQDRLIAGGSFDSMGGVVTNAIAAWDGSVWTPLPGTPTVLRVTDLVAEGGLLHVAGFMAVGSGESGWIAGLGSFDGSQWTPPDWYPSWGIEDVAVAGGKLVAVGHQVELVHGTAPIQIIPTRDVLVRDVTWHDLKAWKPSMRGLLGPGKTHVESLIEYQGQLYAGGDFNYAASPPEWLLTGGLARWDGSEWHPVGERWFWGTVRKMITAGGRLITGGTAGVLAWDGSTWDDLGEPIEGQVSGLTEWQGAIVAVGDLLRSDHSERFNAALNRGSGWEPFDIAYFDERALLTAAATYRNELYVAAEYLSGQDLGFHGLVRWDGSQWSPVPNTPINLVRALLPVGNELWIGGYSYSNGIAVWYWNGATWTAVGEIVGSVTDLIAADGEILACGSINVGGVQATLARWDGAAWQPVEGAPPFLKAIAVSGGDLYVGGSFTNAGNRQAEAIARWSGYTPLPRPGLVKLAPPWPSPARERVTFRLGLRNGGRVQLVLYDLRGAIVARPIDATFPVGAHEVAWSLPHGIRAGVYFARLTSPDGPAVAKVVVAP